MNSSSQYIQNVVVIGKNKSSNPGQVEIHQFDSKDRLMRGLKSGGLFFGLALFSLFIPLAHFVLVPAFLIASFIAFPVAYGAKSKVMGGSSQCPDCQAIFRIEKSADQWPLEDVCSQCQSHVTIEKVTS